MATALEFFKASKTSQQTETGSTYVDYLSITVDRSGESGAKDFFIIAHLNIEVSATAALIKCRLRKDSATPTALDVSEIEGGLSAGGSNSKPGRGVHFVVARQVNLTAASHTFSLEFARESGTDNVIADNGSIVVLEKSAGAEYAENTSETCDTSNVLQDAVTLTFDPGSANHVFIWSAEHRPEDDDDNDTALQFINTTDSVTFYLANRQDTNTSQNNNVYRTSGGVAFEAQAGSTTYKIQFDGRTASDEHCVRKAAIIAIPFADFENVYSDCNGPGSCATDAATFHDLSNGWTDSNATLASQTVLTADHLVLGGAEFSNEGGEAGRHRLVSDTTNFESRSWHQRDNDDAESYLSFHVHGVALTAGDKDFKIQGNSSVTTNNREGVINNAYLVVCEIPAAAAAAATPVIPFTVPE